MIKTSSRAAFLCGVLLTLSPFAQAIDLWPFGKKADKSAPPAEELKNQEAQASSLLASAASSSKPMSIYKQIVDKYPFTQSASAAQFKIAESYETSGDLIRAFEEYQLLVDTHKSSAQFSKAIDSQFNIAQKARKERLGSFFGIVKKKTGPEQNIKMFKQVVSNAPQGRNAAQASMEIGRIHQEEGDASQAIDAYQDVADQYPKNPLALEAQRLVAELNLGKVEAGTRDAGALNESREAASQLGALLPGRLDEDTLQLNEQISEASAANSFRIAKFYDKQGKHKSAMIYYNEVLKLPGGPNFEAARDRVNELTSKDPTLVEQKNIKISPKQLAIKAQADTKSRPDYLGPPAPVDLSKRMRRDSNPAAIDIAPIEEAALPMETPTGAPDASLLAPAAPAPDVPTESGKMEKEKGTAIAEPALPSLEKPTAEGEAPAPAAPEGEKKEEVKPAEPK